MIRQPRPPGALGLRSLAAWSLAVGLAWLLLGQPLAGQPAIHLDLAGALPGTAPVHRQPAAPAPPAPGPGQPAPAPRRQTSPPSSTRSSSQRSTGTSPQPQRATATWTATWTGTSPQHAQAAARAVAFALAQQGKPYQWGAEGPGAYDCSGLVWLAWQHAGLGWARMTAAGQWHWLHDRGHDVPATKLRPGDLLFYANNPHDPTSIHHVAIAVSDRRMVEAAAPGVPVRVVAVRQQGLYAAARPVP